MNDADMREVVRTYGGLAFDSNSGLWGLWCESHGGFYITYTNMETMYDNVQKVMLSESTRVSEELKRA